MSRPSALVASLALALALAACSGGAAPSASPSGETQPSATSSAAAATRPPCGTVKIAQNAWAGYYANVAVVSYLLRNELGCDVEVVDLDEETSWSALPTGEVDAILENWGHEDLAKQYITDQGVAVDLGPSGNEGVIGWFVPKFYADEHPEILTAATNPKILNTLATDFVTSESKGKGQVLDGAESFGAMDEDIIRNLGLDYSVVYSGSEATSNAAIKAAIEARQPILAYYWTPNYFSTQVDLVHVPLPPYVPGCDADTAKITCTDYPPYALNKVVSKSFAESGSPAFTVVKNFTWTNADQDGVAYDIAVNGMSYDDAAKKWLDAHPDAWKAWLAGIPGVE